MASRLQNPNDLNVSQTKVLHPARNTFVHDNKHMCALFFSPPMHNRLPMSLSQAPVWLMIAQRTMNYIELQLSCLKPQLGSRSTARSKPAQMESAGPASRCARGTCRRSGAGSTPPPPYRHLTDTSQTPHRHLTDTSHTRHGKTYTKV